MGTLTWGSSLKVGFGDIDVQHQHLVDLLNRLQSCVNDNGSRETLAVILRDLVRYTQLHFSFEEKLMERYGLDQTQEHHGEHSRITADVLTYQHRFESGEIGLENELLEFMSAWLRGHILGADRELAAQLIAAGADSAA